MRPALVALLLLPLVASAQDMPLFTFTKSGEGWVKAEGKVPEPDFAVLQRQVAKGWFIQSQFTIGANRFAVEYTDRLPLAEPDDRWKREYVRRTRPDGGHLTAAVLTAAGQTVYAGFAKENAVWAFTPDKEGVLTNGSPYAPLRTRKGYDNTKEGLKALEFGPPKTGVGALLLDTAGRLYAATSQDLQVFDPTGRLSGVLTLPAKGKVDAMTWEGKDKDTLAMWIDGQKWTRAMKP